MKDKLVKLYEAHTMYEANQLADRLDRAGIESFAGVTDLPAVGLIGGRQSKTLMVRSGDLLEAMVIAQHFEAEGHPGVHTEEEGMQEEMGPEVTTPDRPCDDSPAQGPDIGWEIMDEANEAAESAEVEELLEEPQQFGRRRQVPPEEAHIESFGADRPLVQQADVEREEVEDQDLRHLDLSTELNEPETGHPAAAPPEKENADEKPPRRRRKSA